MIISPDLVIYTILISVKATQLSLMFLFAILSLHPSSLMHASISAEAAAATGEALKDEHHENNVSCGGLFYPLIVETFGVWKPFAIETLKNIAARTTARNGLSTKRAFRNLIQQLSKCLMLRLSSATGTSTPSSTQLWRKMSDLFAFFFFFFFVFA